MCSDHVVHYLFIGLTNGGCLMHELLKFIKLFLIGWFIGSTIKSYKAKKQEEELLKIENHFSEWSFGEHYSFLPERYWISSWNKLHGNYCFLDEKDNIDENLKVMFYQYAKTFKIKQ